VAFDETGSRSASKWSLAATKTMSFALIKRWKVRRDTPEYAAAPVTEPVLAKAFSALNFVSLAGLAIL
jgi:hypothetical protein